MNNIVEYEACILDLETTLELGIKQMEVFSDSNLVLKQIQGDWRTRDVKLRSYLSFFCGLSTDVVIRPLLIESRSGTYLEATIAKDRRTLRQLTTRFVICGVTLYRRSTDGMLLLCLDQDSADRMMREVHVGVCCPHMRGHMLSIHGDLIHAPPSELYALTSPWPFSVWGIDIIGKISPKSSSGHEFILVAIDYFTKSHIIRRYGVPHELISDKGVHFRAKVDTSL
ncbi:hypothetical protein CK203_113857 [Vitis vinifera]|uniref:RNase H type-1 domain-containing protein n=1 Tax=Vitis vinifera TaxID=29760 RepID=A0A438FD68_VITVI|nr:hypothetical protein CK203_113857 [Vitis vinifera]